MILGHRKAKCVYCFLRMFWMCLYMHRYTVHTMERYWQITIRNDWYITKENVDNLHRMSDSLMFTFWLQFVCVCIGKAVVGCPIKCSSLVGVSFATFASVIDNFACVSGNQITLFKLVAKIASYDITSQMQSSWGQHGAHLSPVGPRWAPCWPHYPCYQRSTVV